MGWKGGWGGFCTCPDGQVYGVGDNNDACRTLACYGGRSSTCFKSVGGPWSGNKVNCESHQQIERRKEKERNEKEVEEKKI